MSKLARIESQLREIEDYDYEGFLELASEIISSEIGCYMYPSNMRDEIRESNMVEDTIDFIEEHWDID